jgi:hypothetical protein
VTTERQELTIPPGVTLDQIRGFTLYAARSIFSGNGGEILQLAKTNLRRLEREWPLLGMRRAGTPDSGARRIRTADLLGAIQGGWLSNLLQ